MPVWSTLKRAFGVGTRSVSGGGYVPAAPVLSGTYITPQTALGLTAVYAAINAISRDTSTLPLGVYEKLPNGGLRLDESHPLNDRLRVNANEERDSYRHRRDSMGHVLGWGNSYVEIVRRKGDLGDGSVVELNLLHPAETKPKRNDAGRLYYELANGKKLLPEDVLHFAGLGFNGIQGYSPVTVCRQSLGVGVGAEQFGAAFFGNGAIAKGILKLAKRLSPQAQANLRASINQVHQGSQSAHQFMILEEGMDWVQTQISPEDGQWLGTRQFQVVEVARIFGVPPHLLGDYSQAHLSNVEQANLLYMTTTLVGWVTMLEAQLNWKLLTSADRKRYVVMHDFSALLRGDSAARSAYYQTMRNLGAMNADEIRTREGMNPLPPGQGGDLYLVQSQYTRLDRAGAPPAEPEPVTAKRFVDALTPLLERCAA